MNARWRFNYHWLRRHGKPPLVALIKTLAEMVRRA